MSKRKTKKTEEEVTPKDVTPDESPPAYKSATCSLSAASAVANRLHKEGYDVKWSFSVVANDEEGKPIQAVYLLAKARETNKSAEP